MCDNDEEENLLKIYLIFLRIYDIINSDIIKNLQ